MDHTNEMQLIFDSRSSNESFARVTVAAFMTSLNPTVEEVSDVKTAVSEAVTNAIIHGYEGEVHNICIRCRTKEQTLFVEIEILEKVSKMLKRQWNHFLQQKRKRNDLAWDFPLWKHLWIVWKWNLHQAKGHL